MSWFLHRVFTSRPTEHARIALCASVACVLFGLPVTAQPMANPQATPTLQGSTVDQVGEAFRIPALGLTGLQDRPRRTVAGDAAEALGNLGALDDTRALNTTDGPGSIAPTVHVSLGQLRGALWYWLDSEERLRLDRVDLRNTSTGSSTRVAYFLADRVLRRFAPMALGARSRRAEAVALRSSAEIRDAASAQAALRLAVVSRVTHRREAVESASVREFALRMQRLGAAISRDCPTDDERDRAADAAVVAAADAVRTTDMNDVAFTIAEAAIAFGSRAERQVVVDEAIHLLEEAAAVARGNPTVERPLPPLPVSIDPDADMVALLPRASGQRPTGHTGASGRRARTAAATTVMVRREGPSAQCYNDFRCFAQ